MLLQWTVAKKSVNNITLPNEIMSPSLNLSVPWYVYVIIFGAILSQFQDILVSCVHVWNDSPRIVNTVLCQCFGFIFIGFNVSSTVQSFWEIISFKIAVLDFSNQMANPPYWTLNSFYDTAIGGKFKFFRKGITGCSQDRTCDLRFLYATVMNSSTRICKHW